MSEEQKAHSKVGASSMDRWENCPGSVAACEGLPEVSSAYSDEGTLAHDFAAKYLMGFHIETCETEMREHLQVYFDEASRQVATLDKTLDRLDFVFVEQRFDLSSIHPGLFGTADLVVYNPRTRVLYVTDLKYGAGVAVEVVDNSQLMYYALGALVTLGFDAREVEITIVQPRAPHKDGPVRKWRIDAIDLLDFSTRLVAAAKRTEEPGAPLVPGDHCRWCKASPKCPALRSLAISNAAKEFAPAVQYEPQDLADTLEKIDVIESWCKSVRSFAYAEAQHGRVIPGWKMVAKRATRKWVREDAYLELAKKTTLAPIYFLDTPSPVSPAQAEKILKSHSIGKEVLGELVVSASSGLKLVRESEPGVPVTVGPGADFAEVGSGGPEANE
jgi:hypothetical protein